MFLRRILYPFSAPISTLNSVRYQKNRNFISTAVSNSTLANPTLNSRGTLRSTYQSRRPCFRSKESPCGIFVWRPATVITFFLNCLGFLFTVYRYTTIGHFSKTTGQYNRSIWRYGKKRLNLANFQIQKQSQLINSSSGLSSVTSPVMREAKVSITNNWEQFILHFIFYRVPYCFLFRWSRFLIPVQNPAIIYFGFSKQTQRYFSRITSIKTPSFCTTTESCHAKCSCQSYTPYVLLLQSHDCSSYVSRQMLTPPPLWLHKHTDLGTHDFAHSPNLWEPKLANVSSVSSWILYRINSVSV